MSEHNPADIGGEAAGPIDTVDHGMEFWEKQANALRSTLTSGKVLRLDELRRTAEDLGPRYYQLSYFQRTTEALRNVLLEKRFFTEAELEQKMAEVRKRYVYAGGRAPLQCRRSRRCEACVPTRSPTYTRVRARQARRHRTRLRHVSEP